jgi:hypothetical protein
MLRLIFTALATLALLFIGALWLAAQPSGSGVREVFAPVLNRGFEIVGAAGKRAVTTASRDLPSDDDASSPVTLTPTASGVWEPEPASKVPEAVPEAKATAPVQPEGPTEPRPPRVEPENPRRVIPEPDASLLLAGGGEDAPPEEIALVPPASRPFRESTRDESEGAGRAGSGGDGPVAESAGPAPDLKAGRFDRDGSAPPDQDGWAALIRRMLLVHSRVSGSE